MPKVEMVVFDVGETLVDETRHWNEWADWMGVPRLTFLAVLGGVIQQGRHHRDAFKVLRPDFDYEAERRKRIAQGWRYKFEAGDFYPDAVPCLRELGGRGYRLGVVGNQYRESEEEMARLGVPFDLIGSSEAWGAEKPSAAFFARLAQEAKLPPARIAYVGDHPVHDIAGAADAGLIPVFLVRGPWGVLHAESAEAKRARLRIGSLAELPDALDRL
jgi:HAD superfamily hydrolase (TIGR01549 family)